MPCESFFILEGRGGVLLGWFVCFLFWGLFVATRNCSFLFYYIKQEYFQDMYSYGLELVTFKGQ